MENNNNNTNNEQAVTSYGNLTTRNKLFLELLADGKDVYEAYKEAGYKGSKHAAYVLKSELKLELAELVQAKGFSFEGVSTELLRLNSIPLHETAKAGVNFNQKLKLLTSMAKILLEAKKLQVQQGINENRPKLTAFIVNAGTGKVTTVEPSEAMIVPEVKPDEPQK